MDLIVLRLECVPLTVHVYSLGMAFLSWVLKSGQMPPACSRLVHLQVAWLSSVMGSDLTSHKGSLSSAAVCVVLRRPIISRGSVLGLILLVLGCSELPKL